MPQVSLYMSDAVYTKVRKAAESEGESVSKWVSRTLEVSLAQDWPEGFGNLFGSITDDAFVVPHREVHTKDAPREPL